MRVLSVIHDLGPGGTQRAANHTVGYAHAGVETALLATRTGGVREADLNGVETFIQREDQPAHEALRQAAAWRPDAVHIHRTGHPDAWLLTVGLPDTLESRRRALPADARQRTVSLPVTNDDDELALAYASMDVLEHHAKRGETFGMVFCEAALCGTPAITVSQPLRDNSQVEVVAHNTRGLVAGNARAFTDAMRRLAESPETRHRLAENAREWALSCCNIDTITTRFLTAFRIILDAGGDRDAIRRNLNDAGEITAVSPDDLMKDLKGVPGASPRIGDRVRLALSSSRTLTDLRQFRRRLGI